MSAWVAIDLDGTLAIADDVFDPEVIGDPVPAIVQLVIRLLQQGLEVKVFTARVARTGKRSDVGVDDDDFADRQEALIKAWTIQHIGVELESTAVKDFEMIALYDDRAIRVERNTGKYELHEVS